MKNDIRGQNMKADVEKPEETKKEEQNKFCSSKLSADDLKEIIAEIRLE